MKAPSSLQWLFLDLNSYFASVEQQDNPALRGRPIAVVPMQTDSTCAIAASYEAKLYGIKTGTPIYEARRLCPGLITVQARHDIYVDYHHRIIEEVAKYTPINKIWSVDELSSRLPPDKQSRDQAISVAARIKEGLRRNIGKNITCSIGLAPNSFLAKVATDMQKPDGLVVLEPDSLETSLFRLKLTDLPGINVNMEARLRRAGIHTVADLWAIQPKHARRIWGSVGGERFWYNLHGYDIPDLETKKSMIGHSRILDPALRPVAHARLIARRLTVKAASRLRRHSLYAASFDLSVRTPDGRRWAAGAHLLPSQDSFIFLRALESLWAQMMRDMAPRTLKKVSVHLHNLQEAGQITPDLFEESSASVRQHRTRNEALSRVMDGLNRKFGAETINLGMTPKTSAGFVGTKIAFSRIPDRAEFHE